MIKWTATALIIAATFVRSFDLGHYLDLIFSFGGTALWAYAAWKMRENALLAVNAFCLALLSYGLLS